MEPEEELKTVIIYTDGGCIGNPGPGGYGVVLLYGAKRREISGGFRRTTNNRMEIMAAIAGLQTLRYRCAVTIYTDSQYLADSIMKGWAARWKANGWKRNQKDKAGNPDLWERLLELCAQHEVRFEWVKGHAGNAENECCDRLSVQAAHGNDLPADDGYENPETSPDELFGEDVSRSTQAEYSVAPPAQAERNTTAKIKITAEGQPCRKCGTPVVKKQPQRKHRSQQEYYYEYYLSCPGCGDMYMVESAKRRIG